MPICHLPWTLSGVRALQHPSPTRQSPSCSYLARFTPFDRASSLCSEGLPRFLLISVLMPVNCLKTAFVLTSARNLSQLKQFRYMHLKGLVTHFQKLMLFMLWLTVSKVWLFEVKEFLRNFCWVRIFFDILITGISWTVAQTLINHSIFWKSVIRCTYINCFKKLRLFA